MNLNTLFRDYKTRLIAGFIGLILLAILIIFLMKSCGEWKPTDEQKNDILGSVHTTPTTSTVETKQGGVKIVYQKDTKQIETLEGLIKILRGDTSRLKAESLQLASDYEQIKEDLKSAKGQIRSLLSMTNEQRIKLESIKAVQINDSVYIAKYTDVGGWFDANLQFDSKNTSFGVDLKTMDKYNVVYFSKKVDGKEKQFFKVENGNPYSKVVGLNSFEVPTKEVKQRRLGLGIMAGYGAMYGEDKKIHIGPTLNGGLYYRIF